MAAHSIMGRVCHAEDLEHHPISSFQETISTDFFWPTPSSLQTSDYFRFPVWDKHTTCDPPPRALEELYLERSYLVDSLHAQIQNASQLMRKIPVLEFKLQQPHLRPLHRKIRKRLGWLKSRLGQSGQQEKTICARLGQLASDIQTREQWTQVELQQQQQRAEIYQREQGFGYQQGLCDGYQMMRMSLDPEQPEFRPQGLFPHMFWPQCQQQPGVDVHQKDDTSEHTSEPPLQGSAEKSPEESPRCEFAVGKYNSHNPNLARRSASMDGVDLRLLVTDNLIVPVSMHKRYSYPSLPGCLGIWDSTVKEQGEVESEKAYSGRKVDRRTSRKASLG
ncbi:hypothetical protein BKA64DRAFT_724236 [Cadophora sp. MPI-SDFR-AT-0126]|nr:hypothetical protein BKA64DRAFT_724236 [Leotiomycetes sp. MPI-SDFR-AT-0126]